LLVASLHAFASESPSESSVSSSLLAVEGTVEFLAPGISTWKSVGPNQVLRQGERLRTARNSRATLRLSDRSLLRIGELTTVVIEKPGTQKEKSLMHIKSGSAH